jgi:hypothetical protein
MSLRIYPIIDLMNYKKVFLTRKANAISLMLLLMCSCTVFSQESDSTKRVSHFGGTVTITNKGISTIPNLTLGKPAALFTMSVGRKISFEPEFRFALEGKPWSFIFWWRYQLYKSDKFITRAGINPSVYFKTSTITTDGVPSEKIIAQRSLTGDLSPTYLLDKNISIGLYYMYIHGFEVDAVRNTHFLAFRPYFSNIILTKQFFMRFYPQVYYLRTDANDGFYVSSTLILAKRNLPLSFSSMITTPIQTNIPAGSSTIWNVSLVYTFNKDYVEK